MDNEPHGARIRGRLVAMNVRRTLLFVVFLGGLSAVLTGALWQLESSRQAGDGSVSRAVSMAGAGSAGVTEVEREALRVLAGWDTARAAAYAGGDVRALAGLYVPGSSAGREDVRMLRAYVARGLRVTGMRTQVLSAKVRASGPRTLTLVVTDRLAQATAAGRGSRVALPHDAPTTRTVTMRRVDERWLVDEVS